MRSSTRTSLKSRVSSVRRSPGFPPSSQEEDWSPRRFYKTMRHIFRPDRQKPGSLVEIPFYDNRPLGLCPMQSFGTVLSATSRPETKSILRGFWTANKVGTLSAPNQKTGRTLNALGFLQKNFGSMRPPLDDYSLPKLDRNRHKPEAR